MFKINGQIWQQQNYLVMGNTLILGNNGDLGFQHKFQAGWVCKSVFTHLTGIDILQTITSNISKQQNTGQ